jgi:hypothetical protein
VIIFAHRQFFGTLISAGSLETTRLLKKYSEISHQKSIPGIGLINAVKIVARIVTPYRFADKGHYWGKSSVATGKSGL